MAHLRPYTGEDETECSYIPTSSMGVHGMYRTTVPFFIFFNFRFPLSLSPLSLYIVINIIINNYINN